MVAPNQTKASYPDDLDDTFTALYSLYKFDRSLITGNILAKVTRLLLKSEINPGGPYTTWITVQDMKSNWQDTDIGVNSNIAYFLSLLNIRTPALMTYFDNIVQKKQYESKYYTEPSLLFYFLSHVYTGEHKKHLCEDILTSLHKIHTPSSVQIALSLSSLINLGWKKDLDTLADILESKGTWTSDNLYLESNKNGRRSYFQSNSVSIALCLEALSLYQKSLSREANIQSNSFLQDKTKAEKVLLQAMQYKPFKKLSEDVLHTALSKITASKNIDEIISYPFYFAKTINSILSDKQLHSLAMANLFGWASQTIYDNMLDGDSLSYKAAQHLPVANLFSRHSQILFCENCATLEMRKHVLTTFDSMDKANSWESLHCRFDIKITLEKLPDYKNYSCLADKSIGHSIPFILIQPTKIRVLETFFKNYCIARQISDDAHDWWQDLENDKINSVSSLLISDYMHACNKTVIVPAKEKIKLQRYFWNHTSTKVADLIHFHIQKAKVDVPQILLDLLKPLEKSIEKTTLETIKMKDFLTSFTF